MWQLRIYLACLFALGPDSRIDMTAAKQARAVESLQVSPAFHAVTLGPIRIGHVVVIGRVFIFLIDFSDFDLPFDRETDEESVTESWARSVTLPVAAIGIGDLFPRAITADATVAGFSCSLLLDGAIVGAAAVATWQFNPFLNHNTTLNNILAICRDQQNAVYGRS